MGAVRNSLVCLFPDNVITKAEEEIGHHDDKYYSGGSLRSLTGIIEDLVPPNVALSEKGANTTRPLPQQLSHASETVKMEN